MRVTSLLPYTLMNFKPSHSSCSHLHHIDFFLLLISKKFHWHFSVEQHKAHKNCWLGNFRLVFIYFPLHPRVFLLLNFYCLAVFSSFCFGYFFLIFLEQFIKVSIALKPTISLLTNVFFLFISRK